MKSKAILKKLNSILNIVIGLDIGAFIGYGICVFWDYKTYPDLYEMRSAPWYTNILIHGICAFAVLMVTVIIKFLVQRKRNGKQLE